MDKELIHQFINNALSEDVGDGDHTSLSTIPADATGKAKLLVKDEGILAGIELAAEIFHVVDPNLKLNVFLQDGAPVKYNDIAFEVEGNSRSILTAERLVLNCMQRMSGIATKTRQIVDLLKGTNTKVLDTRKTTPGLRYLEKWAVRIGGGVNHRFGLYDMILIKDNHVDYAGGIRQAIESANQYLTDSGKKLAIEIEVRNLDELEQVLQTGRVNRILLDNFNFDDLRQAVGIIQGRYITEASGGITIDNIREYADCGVDYISVGALTHSVKSLDLSLKAVK
ncbi:carboxylating nicotinate-nucleotide diphosphorylase [Mucilaginibacter rubeus]|uniref:Probable nicotinate-nucleotide pyrophosphorylase [carboxylating] n=1 Tax=Mucilaginibacter rubeus TaxID=2027860 RepID=A0AAE6MJ04_9SPHI|nr:MULTISPECIES: carboxylating nicotinate-nucleotide diphosphorylase [Mucilaginibacter]QEM05360.1 carboxylating nicotinate-nucleotide diphosphorylase [Mucilaginibacter rubeus]QEM17949.1 carboxylating nicotinate-nucleotide diphosphorylase [Mucilaginibacter gossypii]QTE45517.1 carboxylating nicotinate-nucleotide diphosphorylase [Mucilaginibacter rubeus]QTE52114.1 carboxylating nicotinate-nucleotide diphosphorylase [Mucilaginibacter rubeus]QTE57202.1 carboxylating nicotinate-nucleotide diphosphor